jgi:hypothetical protein
LDVIVNFFSFPLHASIETPTPSDHEAERSWSWTGHEAGGTAGKVHASSPHAFPCMHRGWKHIFTDDEKVVFELGYC